MAESLISTAPRKRRHMLHPTRRSVCVLVAGVTTVWAVMIAMITGFVSALFPTSITIGAPNLYSWASRFIDPVASLILLGLVIIATIRVSGDSLSDSPLIDHQNESLANVEADKASFTRRQDGDEHFTPATTRGRILLGDGRSRVVLAAILVGTVLVASLIDRALTDDHPPKSLVNSAIVLSSSGQITPALESIMQFIPRSYSSSAYGLYYLASGWQGEIGAWSTAEKLDVLLMRSSVAIRNPDSLVLGLTQYDLAKASPLPRSADANLLSSATSPSWRNVVEAAITWQKSGASSNLIKDLTSASKISPIASRAVFQQAIDLVRTYHSSG